jgi:hypothetical protein
MWEGGSDRTTGMTTADWDGCTSRETLVYTKAFCDRFSCSKETIALCPIVPNSFGSFVTQSNMAIESG